MSGVPKNSGWLRGAMRRWLGVQDAETIMQDARKEIVDALDYLLSGDVKFNINWSSLFVSDHGSRLQRIIERAVSDKSYETARDAAKSCAESATSRIEGRISSEKFIDEIVARLRRKQLTGPQE